MKWFPFTTLLLQLPFCFPLSALRAHLRRSSWQGATLLGQVIIPGSRAPAIKKVSGKQLSRFQFDLIIQGSMFDLMFLFGC